MEKLSFASVALLMCSAATFGQNAGKAIYVSKCSGCHAGDGSSNNSIGRSLKIPDIRPSIPSLTDEELRRIIVDGKGKMPAIKKMDDEKVRHVVLFLRDLAAGNPDSGRAASQPLPDVAAAYRAKCSTCHAQDGTGRTTIGKQLPVPDLTSAPTSTQSDQQWAEAIRSGKGKMPAYGKDFTAPQVNQLVAYVRRLTTAAGTHAASSNSAPPQATAAIPGPASKQPGTWVESPGAKATAKTSESAAQADSAQRTAIERAPPPARQLYAAKCAACHARDGSGTGTIGKSLKVPDLRSASVQSKTDEDLSATISNGAGKMQPYKKKLSSEQIQQLVSYIRTFSRTSQ